jgi:hypothetical protein
LNAKTPRPAKIGERSAVFRSSRRFFVLFVVDRSTPSPRRRRFFLSFFSRPNAFHRRRLFGSPYFFVPKPTFLFSPVGKIRKNSRRLPPRLFLRVKLVKEGGMGNAFSTPPFVRTGPFRPF